MLNKKVIVTGASYGIGAHLAAALVAEGASVASMARSADKGEALVKDLAAKGPGKARFYRCDVSKSAEVTSAFAQAVRDMGGLDALVNVAGVEVLDAAENVKEEDWDYMFDVNAKGTLFTNQAAYPYLKQQGGRILNFASGSGVLGMVSGPAYAASKAAVMGWTRSVAMAWAKDNVTVNVVNPAVSTPMSDHHREQLDPDERRHYDAYLRQRIPIGGKLGDIDRDLVPFVVFMLSDGARFITGQILNVDGGAVMAR